MNNAPHTPGPWAVGNLTDVFNAVGGKLGTGFVVHFDGSDHQYHVATVFGQLDEKTPTTTQGNAEANAALIAAAPDMLSALRAACAVLMVARVEVYNHNREDYPRVEAAIDLIKLVTAKATGRVEP